MILLIGSISVFAILGILFFAVYGLRSYRQMSQNLEKTTLYNETLQTSQEDLQAFRHDFGNILQAIGGYIDKDDMAGLRVYYSELFHDFQTSNNFAYLSPMVVNVPAIYSLFVSKYRMAYSLGITMSFNFFLDFQTLHMKIYEFSRILGILLDNAIEAASECEEKTVRVEIRKDSIQNCQMLVIENTYLDEKVDFEHMFEKGVSSKKHNTGLGLWEVNKILKKYPNVNLNTSYNGHFFTQQLEMYEDVPSQKEILVP